MIFTPAVTDVFSANFLILGVVISIITAQLTLADAFEWTAKTVIASWYGAGLGCLVVAFVTAVNHGKYDPYIGVLVAVPFAILVCLAEQSSVTYCKLTSLYRGDKALLLILVVVAFGGDDPYWVALTAALAYTIGTTIPLIGTVILWALKLLPQNGPPPIPMFAHTIANYFQETTAVAPVGEVQEQELDYLWKQVNKAYMVAIRTPDLHLRGIIFSMISSLGTVRHSLKFASYSDAAVQYLWEPLDHTLNTIRVEAICRLRAGRDDRFFKADLCDLSRDLRRKVTEATAAYMEAKSLGQTPSIPDSEFARFGFATREIARFTALLGDFVFRIENPPSRIRTGWALVKFRVKEWLKKPLFEPLNPPTPWRFRLAFPVRSGLGGCIAAWIILGIGEALGEVRLYGLWMLLPCVFCFLPTPGASLVKGSRRLGGTLLAGLIAVLCVVIHPYNDAAFFVELFVISFAGKLMKCHPKIDYSGLVFAFTWSIVGLLAGIDGHLEKREMVLRSLYRAVLTLCGVLLATLISALVMPVFAYGRLTRATARCLQFTGDAVAESVERIQTATAENRPERGGVDERVVGICDELMKHHEERWSQITDATVETKLFTLLRGYFRSEERRVNASHIIAAQPLLDRLNRRTMVVVSAADSFHPSWRVKSPELVEVLESLSVFAEDMRTAAEELASVAVKHGNRFGLWEARTGRFDEAVSLLGKVERLMGKARRDLRNSSREAAGDGDLLTQCVEEESDLDDLYSLVRALGIFVEAWKQVEYMMYFGYTRGSMNPFDLRTMQSKTIEMRRFSTGGIPRLRTHSFNPTGPDQLFIGVHYATFTEGRLGTLRYYLIGDREGSGDVADSYRWSAVANLLSASFNYLVVARSGSILSYNFYSAFFSGVAACACFYAVILPEGPLTGITVVAPLWAGIVMFVDIPTTADWCLKTITGTIIGAAVGLAVASVVHALTEEYEQYVGVIVMIPFGTLLVVSDASTGCKLFSVYRYDVALITSYVIVAFGPGSYLQRAVVMSLTFLIGSAVPLALVLLLNVLWRVPRSTAPPLPAFANRAASFFETLATLAMSGESQAEWLDKARLDFEEVWRQASDTAASDPELRTVIYRMGAELLAMRKTIRDGLYSEGILEFMWSSLLMDLTDLRIEVVSWLKTLTRPRSRDPREAEGPNLKASARKLESRLVERSLDYSRLQVSGNAGIVPANDVVRFQYAMSSVTRFAMLTQEFYEIVRSKEEESQGTMRLKGVRKFITQTVRYWREWYASPWFSNGPFRGKLSSRLAFPIRLGLSLTVMCLVIIAWGRSDPKMAGHALWAVIAIMLCFLPTAGASLVKGVRRMVGTLLASGIAIACVAIHPHNIEAFFLELFIITFVGKLASFNSDIGYAGLVFSLTWTIVAITPESFNGDEPVQAVLVAAAWRMALNSIGIVAATVLSWIVFPTFATTKMERLTAWELVSQAKLVTTALEHLVGFDMPEAEADAIGTEDGSMLYLSSAERHALDLDAKAEAVILGKMGVLGLATQRVLDVQADVDRLGRSAIVARVAIMDCATSISGPATEELLEPLKGHLSRMVMTLKDAVSRVVLFIVDSSSIMPDNVNAPTPIQDPGVQMQRTYDAFVKLRERLIIVPLDGNSDLMANVLSSGGIPFYHALYTLTLFIEDWREVECCLRGVDSLQGAGLVNGIQDDGDAEEGAQCRESVAKIAPPC
ncbi:Aluminum-activated malate transporter 1 [Perkinsus chesapeaki]|uniref:Aluminum-activated malate transporter 1 n=1 Tax=Perkinsus chesapeaki TaxID=330153 RepID=A0A7J6MQ58_PERCH|nr:Aluminum-activated malate transporter 1 [Perkinsus chesapeaki]